MTVRRLTVALALLALMGCVTRPSDPTADLQERVRQMRYRLDVSGAVTARFDEQIPVRVRVLQDPRIRDIRFFLLEPADVITVREGLGVRGGVNVLEYEGDGTYRIGDPTRTTENAGSSALSGAWLSTHGTDPGATRMFQKGQCEVTIARGGDEGSVRCRRLAADDGATTTVELSWSA